MLKFKSETGGLDWAKKADGPGQDNFEANLGMSGSSDGDVFVAGAYQGTAIFDRTTLHSPGDFDIFFAELNADDDRGNDGKDSCGKDQDGDRRK